MLKKPFALICFISIIFLKQLHSQDIISKSVRWDKYHSNLFALTRNDKNFDFIENIDCALLIQKSSPLSFTLSSVELEPIDERYSDANTLPEAVTLNIQEITIRKRPYYSITISPIIHQNGILKKVVKYQIQSSPANPTLLKSSKQRTYAMNSVLSSGDIYKCAISQTGIYKINLDLLKSLGIETNGINPNTIQVYAREGGDLPRINTDIVNDDLVELPTLKIGLSDNIFNDEDLILCYLESSRTITNTTSFTDVKLSNYDALNYVYIKINGSNSKNLSSASNAFSISNTTVNYLKKIEAHEVDLYSRVGAQIKSGKTFVGEDFEFKSSYDFNFSIPNILPNDTVKLYSGFIGRTPLGTSNSFTININNVLKDQLSFNGISFGFEDNFAIPVTKTSSIIHSSSTFNITVKHNRLNSESNGWIDRLVLNAKVAPIYTNTQFPIHIPEKYTTYNLNLSNVNNSVIVWELTNPLNPLNQSFTLTNTDLIFGQTARHLIAFEPTQAFSLSPIGKVPNQNLHALSGDYNLIIIAPEAFKGQALQLANHKESTMGLKTALVSPNEIYNEFGGGRRDIGAIRDFLKMIYDRSPSTALKYVVLFGDGSYDNKGIKFSIDNLLPTYQSDNFLSPIISYVSDDYLALLDDGEGAYSEFNDVKEGFDISIGRLPITNTQQAQTIVNKIIAYESSNHLGDWKNKALLLADDGNRNLHLNQTENNATTIETLRPSLNIDKLYVDAFKQVSTPAGSRYPDVNKALVDKINSGRLFFNYTGHGGEVGLGHERFCSLKDIASFSNADKLCLFMTATCSFTRWDDPSRISAGEETILNPKGGSIALFTTARTVYSGENFILNQSLLNAMLDSSSIAENNSFGYIFTTAKNNLPANRNTLINSRNFTLIGDPSLKLGLNNSSVRTLTIRNSLTSTDTLKALDKITITGVLVDVDGNALNNFNGIIYPTIYDKMDTLKTLSNDNNSNDSENYSFVTDFTERKNIIYRGRATVTNGAFEFSFIVPKDISYTFGIGKISYYAENGSYEITGNSKKIIVGGFNTESIQDTKGPEIEVKLNNQNFANGGLTSPNPQLLIQLKDENGINTIGNGIGHDITATLTKPNGQKETIVLNEYYQGNIDDFTSGSIEYAFNNLEKGSYSLKIKSWDIANNSSDKTISFVVAETQKLEISHVLNYPNPFTSNTEFQFEHNQNLGEPLTYQINIYTITGKLVKRIHGNEIAQSNRIDKIFWNGLDDFGDKIGKGVYVYNLKVKSNSGGTKEVVEKLILL